MDAPSRSISNHDTQEEFEITRRQIIQRLALYNPLVPVGGTGESRIPTKADEWTILVSEYHRLVDLQEHLHLFSFIFPTEITIECFRRAIDADPDFVYTIVLLNQAWRDLIVSTPSFWNKIIVNNMDEQYTWKLYIALRLSRDLPLSIILRFPDPDIALNLSLLAQEKHRIHTLIIQATNNAWYLFPGWFDTDAMSVALRSLGVLPNLTTLINDMSPCYDPDDTVQDPLPHSFLVQYPRLRRLVGWYIPSQGFTALDMTQIQDISVREPIETFIRDYLPRMPSLRHLYFGSVPVIERVTRSELIKSISNSALQSFMCPWGSCTGNNPLISLTTIQFLSIYLSWEELKTFLTSVGTGSHLKHFRLKVRQRDGDETFAPKAVIFNHLEIFEFSVTPGVNADRCWETQARCIDAFSSTWGDSMPDINRVAYKAPVFFTPGSLLSHLQQINKLEFLTLDIPQTTTDLPSSLKLSEAVAGTFDALTSIQINIPDLLPMIHAPNLRAAHISGHASTGTRIPPNSIPKLIKLTMPLNSIGLFENNVLTDLNELNWEPTTSKTSQATVSPPSAAAQPITSFTLSCRHLESLTFMSSFGIKEQHQILLHMLQHPGSLPRLQQISFSEYPSFGLLLRVLFKRNVVRPNGNEVDRVREVLLPEFPCQNILLRLTFVLAGKIAPLKVLQETLPEHDTAIYDYRIPGCILCFNSGLICQASSCEGLTCLRCRNIRKELNNHKREDKVSDDNTGFPDIFDSDSDWDGENTDGSDDSETDSFNYPMKLPESSWSHGVETPWYESEGSWCEEWQKLWDKRNECLGDMPGGHSRDRRCPRYDIDKRVSITEEFCQ